MKQLLERLNEQSYFYTSDTRVEQVVIPLDLYKDLKVFLSRPSTVGDFLRMSKKKLQSLAAEKGTK
jgi:hypothetical protein